MKFCPNCGAELADDAVFCGACGTQLNVERDGYLEDGNWVVYRYTGV